MTNREFIELVAEMRAVQRKFFTGDRSSATLAESKRLEREVDRAVFGLLSSEQQGELFGTNEEVPC